MAARWRSVLKSKGTTTRWAIVYSSSILLGNIGFSVWQSMEGAGNLSFALEPAFFCGLGQSLHCITFFSTVINWGDGELLPEGPALPRMRSQRANSLFPSKDLGGNSF